MILDGGMGTQIQTYKLTEEDYRGKSSTKYMIVEYFSEFVTDLIFS